MIELLVEVCLAGRPDGLRHARAAQARPPAPRRGPSDWVAARPGLALAGARCARRPKRDGTAPGDRDRAGRLRAPGPARAAEPRRTPATRRTSASSSATRRWR